MRRGEGKGEGGRGGEGKGEGGKGGEWQRGVARNSLRAQALRDINFYTLCAV